MSQNLKYILIAFVVIIIFVVIRNQFGGTNNKNLKAEVDQGAFLVDVRTPAEFASGSAKGAVNIPLNSLSQNLSKLKGKKKIIVFCRSGNRSGQAKRILEQNGFENVINGGTWQNVNKASQGN